MSCSVNKTLKLPSPETNLALGKLVSLKSVSDNDDLMINNKSGIAIRMAVEDLRVMGRATQGVKLINLKGNDSIAAVAKVMKEEDEEVEENDSEQKDENNESSTQTKE